MNCSRLLLRRDFLNTTRICGFSLRSINSNSPIKTTNHATDDQAQQNEKQLARLQRKKEQLARFDKIPAEYHEGPRKEVFHQIKRSQNLNPIYTMEEAALPGDHESIQRYFKYPYLSNQHSDTDYFVRSNENEYSLVHQFPEVTDFLMVGAGLIGSATAYYVKKKIDRVGDVCVLDKDPYSPTNCTAICSGLLSSQTKSRDTFRVSTLSKELIRNLQNDVLCKPEDFAIINYRPCTHLVLWKENQVEEVINTIDEFIQDGCYTEAKLPAELEQTFPWLRVVGSDVALGSHGNQDEAIIDPIGLRNLYRTLAQAHGVNFVVGEAIDFNTMYMLGSSEINPNGAGAFVARIPANGELRNLGFLKTLLCLGHNTPFLESRSDMELGMRDQIEDLHFLQPKLRICFHFHSLATPCINFPAITDTDGSLLIKEDFAGNFKYYLPYAECEEFLEQDMDTFMDLDEDEPYLNLMHRGPMFGNYFENVIKPKLVKRIPLMEDAQFDLAYSGFENYNSHDGSPIISIHPFHDKVLLSGGYGSRLMTYGPSAAAAFSELMVADEEEVFDMTPFYWNRVIKNRTVPEFEILVQ